MEFSDHDTENALTPQFLLKLSIYVASPPISESVLRQEYLVKRLSLREIASELACSKTHIRDQLLKHNIPLRQPHRRYNKWHAYGKQQVGGKTIDHKTEQRTIATIRQMYSEGVGTRAIARFLNTMKIPPNNRVRVGIIIRLRKF